MAMRCSAAFLSGGLGVLASIWTGMASAQGADGYEAILDTPELRDVSSEDRDPNQELINALTSMAKKGAVFKLDPDKVMMSMKVGDVRRETIRITNTGDAAGEIRGISSVGAIEGLEVEDDCTGAPMDRGSYCQVTVTYRASEAGRISTIILGLYDAKKEGQFEIPVSILVTDRDATGPAPATGDGPNLPDQATTPPAKGPSANDVASAYFMSMGYAMPGLAVERGFTIVRAPADVDVQEGFAGVSYRDVQVETITEDARYDPDIPWTSAGLPVDRSRILTTDRVIKAVLETPVSNVLCSKTVALVESDVFSATSPYPLIPAGSRVVGECREFVDERVGIVWTRIITTDGRSITFDAIDADTRDATGRGGALGRVYMSAFDKYVLPIFSTMIDTVAGVTYAIFGEDEDVVVDANGNTIQSKSARNEGIRIVTEEARGTAQQVIKDVRDVRKVVVVPAGSRIDIEINEDIYFRDSRKIVRVADMTFGLDDLEEGKAVRDMPGEVRLIPVARDYRGATISVGDRRFRIDDKAPGAEGDGRTSGTAPAQNDGSDKVIADLAKQ